MDDTTREIMLAGGQITIVDAADFDWLNQWKWHYQSPGYVGRYGGGGRKNRITILMHRVICGALTGFEVDHINGDGLDNRRSNLRICTHAQNLRNQKHKASNTSGYKGVYLCKCTGRWRAGITVNYKKFHLGRFATAEEAADAYAKAADKYHGGFQRA